MPFVPDRAIVQISLDLTSLPEAIDTAAIAVDAGVDWLEAGTPLLLAHGLRAVETLRARFPDHPIVADLKTMDGGYLEAEMMAKAGATHVVVMGRAHEATIRRVIDAGREYNVLVMGDNLAADDRRRVHIAPDDPVHPGRLRGGRGLRRPGARGGAAHRRGHPVRGEQRRQGSRRFTGLRGPRWTPT
jgi:orotidine-5'-phosphate decarboxylase